MRIAQVIQTLDPKYGGPVAALRDVTSALADLGHRSDTVTLDSPDAPWINDFPGTVIALGPGITPFGYSRRLIPWLVANAPRYDAFIARGIWRFQSIATRRAALKAKIPYHVFVHGALDPWFKHAFPLKHLKKWLYWPWGEYRVLRDATSVLFTSEEERRLAAQSFWLYRVKAKVVDYGVRAPFADAAYSREEFLNAFPELRDKRLILYLGRIHSKKGIDLAISAFARVSSLDSRLRLVLAGPDAVGLRTSLDALARNLGVANLITWCGMLGGSLKDGAFYASEAFCLPSHSENFGIAVAEALGRGVPVLISDKVNIWREVDLDGAGFVGSDDEKGIGEIFERWVALSPAEREAMSGRAKHSFDSRFEIHQAARALIRAISQQDRVSLSSGRLEQAGESYQ